jgi:polyferredoxin
MDRIGRPRGLIRLASHRAITSPRPRWLTPRVGAYIGVWLALVALVTTLIAWRPELDVLILRQAGTMFTQVEGGDFANFYTVQVFNRTAETQTFEIVAVEPAGARITPLGPLSAVRPHDLLEGRLVLAVPASRIAGAGTPVRFEVRVAGRALHQIESSFVGPGTRRQEPGNRR